MAEPNVALGSWWTRTGVICGRVATLFPARSWTCEGSTCGRPKDVVWASSWTRETIGSGLTLGAVSWTVVALGVDES